MSVLAAQKSSSLSLVFSFKQIVVFEVPTGRRRFEEDLNRKYFKNV